MRRMRTRQTIQRGFTLIELLLVMVILAILAAVVVPRLAGNQEKAKKAAAKADIAEIGAALDRFEVDCGHYPSSDEGLQALVQQPGDAQGWSGPYVKQAPLDPWKNPYVYTYPGTHNTKDFDLFSTEGGKDTSGNDINNWSSSSSSN